MHLLKTRSCRAGEMLLSLIIHIKKYLVANA